MQCNSDAAGSRVGDVRVPQLAWMFSLCALPPWHQFHWQAELLSFITPGCLNLPWALGWNGLAWHDVVWPGARLSAGLMPASRWTVSPTIRTLPGLPQGHECPRPGSIGFHRARLGIQAESGHPKWARGFIVSEMLSYVNSPPLHPSSRSQAAKPSEDWEQDAEWRILKHVGGCWLLVANIQSRKYPVNIHLIMCTQLVLNWSFFVFRKDWLVPFMPLSFFTLSCRWCFSTLVGVKYFKYLLSLFSSFWINIQNISTVIWKSFLLFILDLLGLIHSNWGQRSFTL